jgi:hypothetical protein
MRSGLAMIEQHLTVNQQALSPSSQPNPNFNRLR